MLWIKFLAETNTSIEIYIYIPGVFIMMTFFWGTTLPRQLKLKKILQLILDLRLIWDACRHSFGR